MGCLQDFLRNPRKKLLIQNLVYLRHLLVVDPTFRQAKSSALYLNLIHKLYLNWIFVKVGCNINSCIIATQQYVVSPMQIHHLGISTILIFALVITGQAQNVIHPKVGTVTWSSDSSITLRLAHKIQRFDWQHQNTLDKDINSPKSVNFHPNGKKFYVNSLEGCATIAYETGTWRKIKVIRHQILPEHRNLWTKPCGMFPFRHYSPDSMDVNKFSGKPVESVFSHNGRYIWVPYYRRTFDLNAQDPSALAVIDTELDTIIRLMETGPLPKMIACSHDGKHIAVTHWGDNTVAVINAENDNPMDWHYEKLYVVDYQLQLNFGLKVSVNRDVNSGYCLRGTVFTPDDQYLLVGCMGGSGGVAVIDMQRQEYLGRVLGMRSNTRHLIIQDGWLYLSCNSDGIVQRIKLERFLGVLPEMKDKKVSVNGWEECAVFKGARTIVASPNGRYVFAACNTGSRLCIVDAKTMKMIGSAEVDSYPVGLDISPDGFFLITTSQGRSNQGGNAVDIFHVDYAQTEESIPILQEKNLPSDTLASPQLKANLNKSKFFNLTFWLVLSFSCFISLTVWMAGIPKSKTLTKRQ